MSSAAVVIGGLRVNGRYFLCAVHSAYAQPYEPATFVQGLNAMDVWNTLGSRCTNVADSLGIAAVIQNSKTHHFILSLFN